MPELPEPLIQQLTSDQPETIRAGLETLMASPHFAEWAEALLEGVEYSGHTRFSRVPRFEAMPAYGRANRYDELIAILALYAPAGCASALQEAIGAIGIGALVPGPLGEAPWERLPALTGLQLTGLASPDLTALAAAPALESLTLYDCPIDSLADLPDLPALQKLTIRGSALTSLDSLRAALPALREVSLSYNRSLADLNGLERYPALTSVHAGRNALSDISALAGLTALESLTITYDHALERLEGIPEAPALRSLGLDGCKSVTSLSALPALPKITQLTIWAMDALVDLSGIERLTELTEVKIRNHEGPLDVGPLAGLLKLEVLDLRMSSGITDIGALDELDALKVILLHKSGVVRKSVSQPVRWRCSWSQNAQVWKLKQKVPPAPRQTPARGQARTSLTAVRRLLKSGEPATIDQGLEIMRTLADPGWFDTLLVGTAYEIDPNWSGPRGYRWRLNTTKFKGPTLMYVVCGLIAAAPPESAVAAALKEKVGALCFVPRRHKYLEPHPIDLRSLEALPNLEHLGIEMYGPSSAQERAPSLASLKSLYLCAPKGPFPMRWLSGCSALTALHLVNARSLTSLDGLGPLPNLRRVTIGSYSALDASALAGLPALESVAVSGSGAVDLSALEGRGIEILRT